MIRITIHRIWVYHALLALLVIVGGIVAPSRWRSYYMIFGYTSFAIYPAVVIVQERTKYRYQKRRTEFWKAEFVRCADERDALFFAGRLEEAMIVQAQVNHALARYWKERGHK